jgi:RWD domain
MNQDQIDEKEALESYYFDKELEWLHTDTDTTDTTETASFTIRVKASDADSSDKTVPYIVVHFKWCSSYPETSIPLIDFDNDHNDIMPQDCKDELLESVLQEAHELLGSPMILSLTMLIADTLNDMQTRFVTGSMWTTMDEKNKSSSHTKTSGKNKKKLSKKKKPKMTKMEKNRMLKHMGADGERVRGWNWVDVCSHLSKTGGAAS